jgi:hypothetical protein
MAERTPAQERLCDTAFEDCRQPLWTLIDSETQRIDVAFWFIQDQSYVTKIINKFRAGVQVRILCDPRASEDYAGNQAILDQFRNAGIPMRFKRNEGILHMKMMLFAGQNTVEFSGANYGPQFFVPSTPFQNYIDEAIYFTDDSSVVDSFKTKFDDLWMNTSAYGDYANITAPLTRAYPVTAMDPELNFPPGEDFYNRTSQNMNQENQKIDIVMYRITNDRYTNTTIAAVNRGIPVRLITEQNEYRNPERQWDAYNVDLMYNAGVQIRIRNHEGLNHEKAVLLYGKGMTIFGSSNWTGPSSNFQQENNYFTTKAWFFQWFVNHFERKWNSNETKPFVPLPPDAPAYTSPANNSIDQPTNMTLRWEGGPWAHKYDIYFGTTPNPPLIAADQVIGRVDNGVPETFTLPPLAAGTTYFWRIVGKTMANQMTSGATFKFTTAGTPAPAPTVTSISPNSGPTAGGTSVTITGTGFFSGATVSIGGSPAMNVAVINSSSLTATTTAHAAGASDVVVRNADGQSGTLAQGFTYVAPPPPPPPGADEIVLYASKAPVKVGAWSAVADPTAAGASRIANPDAGAPKVVTALASPQNYFEMTFDADAGRAYRLWIRGKAQADNPFNDSVHVQFSDSVNSSGSPISRIGSTTSQEINLEDCSGCGLSGWGWQDNGWGVGVMGPLIFFQSTGTHTIRIQVREDGLSIDQIVLSPTAFISSSPGTLKNDTTILGESQGGGVSNPAPTVSSISPTSGSTAGGTSVTITGTGFLSGATVTIGGVSATAVNVASQTSITATTPAHSAGSANVVVRNTDGQSGSLTSGFTYQPPQNPVPTVSAVSPASGPTAGGTSVTITGTGFLAGATVSVGGSAATNVSVASGTTITATTPAHAEGAVNVVVTNTDGQSGTKINGFTYNAPPAGEVVLMEDDFNTPPLDTTKWTANNLFSGFTDSALPVTEMNQRLEIGPLLQGTGGSHYNGLVSATSFAFSGAFCYVELVQAPAANTTGDAMFTIGSDTNNYYRIYVENGSLFVQKRIAGVKSALLTIAYDPASHRFLQIRHDDSTGSVTFEAAPSSGGAPGAWTVLFSESWNQSVNIGGVKFEIKGGTWQAETNAPGKVIFDNFKAAVP